MIRATNYPDRILGPLVDCLNLEAALCIVNPRMDPEIRARVAVLAERANEGELSAEERAEYSSYIDASDLLAVIRLKVKRRLDDDGEVSR